MYNSFFKFIYKFNKKSKKKGQADFLFFCLNLFFLIILKVDEKITYIFENQQKFY